MSKHLEKQLIPYFAGCFAFKCTLIMKGYSQSFCANLMDTQVFWKSCQWTVQVPLNLYQLLLKASLVERSSGSCTRVTLPTPTLRTNWHSSRKYSTVIKMQRSITYQAGQANPSQSSEGHLSLKDDLDPSPNILGQLDQGSKYQEVNDRENTQRHSKGRCYMYMEPSTDQYRRL